MSRLLIASSVASALGLCLLAAGCATVIGLDGYKVGTGGSAGAAGAAGSAGSAGTAGTSGAAGTAGTAGTSGGGSSGTGGTVVGCDGTAFTPNEGVVRSCIMRLGCSPFNPDHSLSDCISRNTQSAFGVDCGLTAQNCDEFAACEHFGIVTDTTCDGAASGTQFCVGDKAYRCDNAPFNYWRDCTATGATGCAVDTSGAAYCVFPGTCTAGTTFACSGDNKYYYECDTAKRLGAACPIGLECNADPSLPPCTPIGTACTTDSATCSASGQAVQCLTGQQETWDCASVGLSCVSGSADAAGNRGYCVAPGCTTTDVSSCVESCSGTRLTLCYGGQPYTIDCTAYGFNTCDTFSTTGPTGVSFDYASCYSK